MVSRKTRSTKKKRRRMTCTLRSTACYVQRPFAEEVKIALAQGPSPSVKKDRSFDDRAAIKVFVLPDGRPCMPHAHLYGSLIMAGTQVKNGSSLITVQGTNRQKDYRGGYHFRVLGNAFPLVNPDDHGEVAKWLAHLMDPPNKQGQRVPEPCPMFEQWQTDVAFEFDETSIREATVNNWLTKAGQGQGVGAGRIGRGAALCYGTFEVVDDSWRDLEDDSEAKRIIVWEKPVHSARLAFQSLLCPYQPPEMEEIERLVEEVTSGNGRE